MGRTIASHREPNWLLYDEIEREVSKIAFRDHPSCRREVWVESTYSGAVWKVDLSDMIHIYRKRNVNIVLEPCTKFGKDFFKLIYTHKSQSFERLNKGEFY